MHIINSAYNYIKNQFQNEINRKTTYEKLEEEFNLFCQEQENQTPNFSQIYEETNDWIREFNKEFDSKLNIGSINDENINDVNPYDKNPFDINNGYGELMDKSLYSTNQELDPEDENLLNQEPINPDLDYKENEIIYNKNIFNKEIIEYQEPEPLPDTISYYPHKIIIK